MEGSDTGEVDFPDAVVAMDDRGRDQQCFTRKLSPAQKHRGFEIKMPIVLPDDHFVTRPRQHGEEVDPIPAALSAPQLLRRLDTPRPHDGITYREESSKPRSRPAQQVVSQFADLEVVT